MPTLLIREIPEALDDFLKRSAERNHRSKEKQALHILETISGTSHVEWSDFVGRPRRKAKYPLDESRSHER